MAVCLVVSIHQSNTSHKFFNFAHDYFQVGVEARPHLCSPSSVSHVGIILKVTILLAISVFDELRSILLWTMQRLLKHRRHDKIIVREVSKAVIISLS